LAKETLANQRGPKNLERDNATNPVPKKLKIVPREKTALTFKAKANTSNIIKVMHQAMMPLRILLNPDDP
jgi:hypothetical protein